MRKGKDVLGKSIVSYDTGEKLERVRDLIFDQNTNRLLGFLVEEPGWFRDALIVPFDQVQAVGADAVVISSKDAIVGSRNLPTVVSILEGNNIMKGTRILTTDGQDLGVLVDLYFDERTGQVEGYEASGGLFADVYSGRSFVPAPQTLKIGHDVAFVPSQTAQLMQEQVGGIKGTIHAVGNNVQDTVQATGERIQEFGSAANERTQQSRDAVTGKMQEVAQVANDKLQNLGQAAHSQLQHVSSGAEGALQNVRRSATSTLTNVVITPEEQEKFVIGKRAFRSVSLPSGGYLVFEGQIVTDYIARSAQYHGVLDELYRATGGSVPQKVSQDVGNVAARFSVEEARGRRAQFLVRTNDNLIIAAPGQIVTTQVIERAKLYHKEAALLSSVGLSAEDAVKQRSRSVVSGTGDRLALIAQEQGEQVQSGLSRLWSQVRVKTNELQERSARALEDKRIKGALGRPVTRVILNTHDEVILNLGELITHEAIAEARQAGVLEVLLSSVYTETPKLSVETMRAPTSGTAALEGGSSSF